MAASKQQRTISKAIYNFERRFELFDLFYLPSPKKTYSEKSNSRNTVGLTGR